MNEITQDLDIQVMYHIFYLGHLEKCFYDIFLLASYSLQNMIQCFHCRNYYNKNIFIPLIIKIKKYVYIYVYSSQLLERNKMNMKITTSSYVWCNKDKITIAFVLRCVERLLIHICSNVFIRATIESRA